jgi:hypothetical protein
MSGNRQVVVVLGMDRAGTSLCTRILHALGMALDEDLLQGDSNNSGGYFESVAVLVLGERLLAALGSCWHEIRTLKPPGPSWRRVPECLAIVDELTARLRQQLQESSGLRGFKDPRTANLLPIWRHVFRSCGVTPIYILAVRHPGAVADSLSKRDGIPRRAAELLWLERYYRACALVGGEIRCVVHYEDWFSRPVEQARRLLAATGLAPPATEMELEATLTSIVSASMQHHRGGIAGIETAAVRSFYDYLLDHNQAPPRAFLRKFHFALHLARDYALVASQLLGRPLEAGAVAAPLAEPTPIPLAPPSQDAQPDAPAEAPKADSAGS